MYCSHCIARCGNVFRIWLCLYCLYSGVASGSVITNYVSNVSCYYCKIIKEFPAKICRVLILCVLIMMEHRVEFKGSEVATHCLLSISHQLTTHSPLATPLCCCYFLFEAFNLVSYQLPDLHLLFREIKPIVQGRTACVRALISSYYCITLHLPED